MVAEQPRVHAGGGRVAGDRHRLQHGALRRRRRAAVQAAAGGGARAARRRLHQRFDRLGHLQHVVVPRLPRPQRAQRSVRRDGRLQPDAGAAQPRQPVAARDGRDRHRQLLSGPRRPGRDRPHHPAERRCAVARRGSRWCRIGTGSASSARRPTSSAARCGFEATRTRSSASPARISAAWCRCCRRNCGCRPRPRWRSNRSACTTPCRLRPARRGSIGAPTAGCSSARGSSRGRRSTRRART